MEASNGLPHGSVLIEEHELAASTSDVPVQDMCDDPRNDTVGDSLTEEHARPDEQALTRATSIPDHDMHDAEHYIDAQEQADVEHSGLAGAHVASVATAKLGVARSKDFAAAMHGTDQQATTAGGHKLLNVAVFRGGLP